LVRVGPGARGPRCRLYFTGSALPNCHFSQVWTDQHSFSRLGHGSAFLAPFSSHSDARDPRGPACAPGAVFLRLGRPAASRARARSSPRVRALIIRIGRFVPSLRRFLPSRRLRRTFPGAVLTRLCSSVSASRHRPHPFVPFRALGRTSCLFFTVLATSGSRAVFDRLGCFVPLGGAPGPFPSPLGSRSHPP
jgi:hypothetical protein